MLTNFEGVTASLSDEELEMVPIFVKSLQKYRGPHHTVTSNDIIKGMGNYGFSLTGARVRKIINYIRMRGLVEGLVASGKGYYIATDPEEINRYISSLQGRIDAITALRDSYSTQLTRIKSDGLKLNI